MSEKRNQLQSQEKQGAISEENILKISKEVVIKFIETGRITPATFDNSFRNIYATIKETVRKG